MYELTLISNLNLSLINRKIIILIYSISINHKNMGGACSSSKKKKKDHQEAPQQFHPPPPINDIHPQPVIIEQHPKISNGRIFFKTNNLKFFFFLF